MRRFLLALLLAPIVRPCAAEIIQLEGQQGTYMVPVRINGAMTLPFVLDTGASAVAIPEDVFLTLTRTGTVTTSDFLGTGTVQLADGSEHASRRFVLHEVQVGNHVVRNVTANVVSVKGDPLLGQSFLSKLPAWSIDNQRHTLVLNDPGSIGPQRGAPLAPPSSLEVSSAWVRATPAQAQNGVAFLTITSPSPDRLVSASSPVAQRAELHTLWMNGAVMLMRQLAGVDIPAGSPVTLRPGGEHIMLIGLNYPLREGGSFPLTLNFEKAGSRVVTVTIEKPGALGPAVAQQH